MNDHPIPARRRFPTWTLALTVLGFLALVASVNENGNTPRSVGKFVLICGGVGVVCIFAGAVYIEWEFNRNLKAKARRFTDRGPPPEPAGIGYQCLVGVWIAGTILGVVALVLVNFWWPKTHAERMDLSLNLLAKILGTLLAATIGRYFWLNRQRFRNAIQYAHDNMVAKARPFTDRGPPPEPAGPGYKILVGLWVFAGIMLVVGASLFASGEHWSYFVGMISNGLIFAGIPTLVRYIWMNRQRLRHAVQYAHAPTVPPPPLVPPAAPPVARFCPKCASPLSADSADGLCPRCLLKAAFLAEISPETTAAYAPPATAPDPAEVADHFPQFDILGLVGKGGMGAVYKARQPALDRIVALKLIRPRPDDPAFAERFAREAKALAKLSHPHIVAVHESGEAGGSQFLVMEFVDGVTLRDAIRTKSLNPAQALAVVGQICDALAYAHGRGVVHRDIKPENILLDKAGNVKIADFGLAKLIGTDEFTLTRTNQAMGTPHYMAPEQWEKPASVDHRADMYALGVVIYELLTGELPLGRFDAPSKRVPLDVRLDEVVFRLLEKEPGRRFQGAAELRTALDLIASGAAGGLPWRPAYEYKSKTTFLGLPLVHIVRGGVYPNMDEPKRTWHGACGWLAISDVQAVGGIAIGGVAAAGGIAISGVCGAGIITLNGAVSLGVVAVGGMGAFGLAVAGGGLFAIAPLAAAGGIAVGVWSIAGAAAAGWKVISGHRSDADFWSSLVDAVRSVTG